MPVLDGVSVTDDYYQTGKAHTLSGGIALMGLLGSMPACANCGGARAIGLYLLEAEGSLYPFPPYKAGHFVNGRWHRSRLITFPCPSCTDETERANVIHDRLEASGLAPNEYDWRPAFVAAMPGKESAASAVLEMFADTFTPAGWLFVYGANGLGKTGLLKSAVAMACHLGVLARYTTASNILNEIYDLIERNKRHDDQAETILELIRRYDRYQVLAIDEVGLDRTADTQFALSKLFDIFDARYARRTTTATLIASNSQPQTLERHSQWRYFESRTRDGLRVPIGGESLRG